MKVRGSKAPVNAFSLVPRPKKPGYVQVRFYENVVPYERIDEEGEISNGYEYDMYQLEMPDSADLESKVLEGYDTLLAQAKAIESGLTNMEDFLGCATGADIVEIVRSAKIAEISKACNAIIVAGIDLELTQGEVHFNLSIEDQTNISNLFKIVELGGSEFPYQSDGGVCRIYTAAEIAQIYIAAQTLITTQTTYHNALKAYVQTLESIESIASAQYGMELPEPFASEMRLKLAVAQEQMNVITGRLGG